jgi:1-pyrroline-5-carboxylate dehydrogenase
MVAILLVFTSLVRLGFPMTFGQSGTNISKYKTYQNCWRNRREDFIIAHPSANAKQVTTRIAVAHFEYQGPRGVVLASTRVLFRKVWPAVRTIRSRFKIDGFARRYAFITAVISEGSFDTLAGFIDQARKPTLK